MSTQPNIPIEAPGANSPREIDARLLVVKSDIDRDCLNAVVGRLAEMEQREQLTLLLESPGGSIEGAFWIAATLRRHCSKLDVAVVGPAKSAATLIALSADRILFGKFGELGPLDAQVLDLSGGARRKSPLETMRGLDFLRDYYLETFTLVMDILFNEFNIDSAHALEQMPNILSPVATPLYQLVDYRELGDALRILSISEAYAREVIRRWNPVSDPEAIERIVRRLVWEYPHHGHIIDFIEARAMGLSEVHEIPPALESEYSSIVNGMPDPAVKLHTVNFELSTGLEEVGYESETAECGTG